MSSLVKFILKTKEITENTPDWGLGKGVFQVSTAKLSDEDIHAAIQIVEYKKQLIDDFIMVDVVPITEQEYDEEITMKNVEEILYTKEQQEKLDKLRNELKLEQEKKRRNRVSSKVEEEWRRRFTKNGNKRDYSDVVVRDEFKQMSTRQLLGMRDFYYYDYYWDTPTNDKKYDMWEIEQREIRAELSTREHVPSKSDKKNTRRKMALKNKGGRRSHKKK